MTGDTAIEEPEILTDLEQEDLVEAEDVPLSVSYSGQDFDVSGLVRRLESEDILIPEFGHEDERITSAGFQRSFVWNRNQMDRFIESLLLGFPIPGIFLVRQSDRRYLVLDGQQRLRTLQYFYEGTHADGKAFSLQNVASALKGLTYKKLSDDQRRMLDDTFIQATIVATDGSADSLEAIYQIFERLNSGGTQLTPHEIRVALYAGPFIDFLARLNKDDHWRALYGRVSPRLRDQELIIRILALYLNADSYKRPLKTFLNNFAGTHRALQILDVPSLTMLFATASKLLAEHAGAEALRRTGYQVNAALTEAVFVGLMRRLATGTIADPSRIQDAIRTVRDDTDFINAITKATSDEENVRKRIDLASAAFSDL